MFKIEEILIDTSHRSEKIPSHPWAFYQEWNDALFMHWEVPFDSLRKLVPEKLVLDSYKGKYYVSVVAFTMQNIRPKNLPSIKYISDFHEINVRTYIENDHQKGVYFLNIEAQKQLSVFIARTLSGLPYEKSNIKRTDKSFFSVNTKKHFNLDVHFEVRQLISAKTELDKWLTERYCLYNDQGKDGFRFDVHHKEWEIKTVDLQKLAIRYQLGEITFSPEQVKLCHYSEGVQVLSWNKQKIYSANPI